MYKDIIEALLLRVENRLKRRGAYGAYLNGIEDTFREIYDELANEERLNG